LAFQNLVFRVGRFGWTSAACLNAASRHLRKPGALTANVKIDLIEIRIALHGFDVVKCRPLILHIPDSEKDLFACGILQNSK
jgi:hypothetical protein